VILSLGLGLAGLVLSAIADAPIWVLAMFGALLPFGMGLGLILYIVAEVCGSTC
jgi:hypothetical protein